MKDEMHMPTIFLSAASAAALAVLALAAGASIWTALATYSLGGTAIALSALLGAMIEDAFEGAARRTPHALPAPVRAGAR